MCLQPYIASQIHSSSHVYFTSLKNQFPKGGSLGLPDSNAKYDFEPNSSAEYDYVSNDDLSPLGPV